MVVAVTTPILEIRCRLVHVDSEQKRHNKDSLDSSGVTAVQVAVVCSFLLEL